jgi:CBS domain-containing protein
MPLESWIPLFTKMVWPAVAVGVVAVYHDETGALLHNFNAAITAGRPVKVADWLEIGAGTPIGDLVKVSATDPGKNIDLSMNRVGGYEEFTFKGSAEFLTQLQEQLRASPGKTIDVLVVAAGHEYSTKLLRSYIAALGIRYVVFEEGERFAGWMDSGLFNSQLPPTETEERWPYEQLRDRLLGLHKQSVAPTTSALDVLKLMEHERVESIAVVDDGKFKSIVSREAIIAKLLVASVFKQEQET